ncbi:MAG: HAD family hydrolase [Planctomycetes bacterium]|nr:HAD family hydrolase [Planctomycetota bacterium]
MADPVAQLKAFPKTRDCFIGIDSDGCAFDTMELKHKECFTPNTINAWDLQAVSRFAREAADFVNLYSRWRGLNRFPALVMVLDLLAERPEALQRGYAPPKIDSLRTWIRTETRLGNPALEAEVARTGDAVLRRALQWSAAVNDTVERFVRGVPPFPFVRESLEKVRGAADVMVVSATPSGALQREWAEHDVAKYAAMICGQEQGSKAEHLRHAAVGRYDADRILMIGDAPGDMKAARANDALFFPINPGREAASWRRFHDEALDRFLAGTYRGAYEEALVEEFLGYLPSTPPWKA